MIRQVELAIGKRQIPPLDRRKVMINREVSEECHETEAVPANFNLERVTTAVFKAVNGARRKSWHNRRRGCSVVPSADGRGLYQELRQLGADYFLVRTDRLAVTLPDDQFFQSHFKFVYAEPNARLFELTEDPVHRVEGEAVLKNPGFEQRDGDWPAGWIRNGAPVVDRSGKNSWAGHVAVRCDGPSNVLSQTADVKAETPSELSVHARSSQGAGSAWLQLSWQDRQGKTLHSHVETIAVGSEWKPYPKGRKEGL